MVDSPEVYLDSVPLSYMDIICVTYYIAVLMNNLPADETGLLLHVRRHSCRPFTYARDSRELFEMLNV